MKPLLEMRTIPISIEYKINKGHYEVVNADASEQISYVDGSIEMQMNPLKLNLDTVETNGTLGTKNSMNSKKNFLSYELNGTYKTASFYMEEGNLMLNINMTDNYNSEIAFQKFNSDINFNLSPIQPSESNVSFDLDEISIKYEMDKLNFDWKINRPQIKFIPGSIEFIIKEYPRVEINYIGSPIFVPPSSDPNYKAIDAMI